MKRISQDYSAMKNGKCEICGYRIFGGMWIFDVELKNGRKGQAHSTCERVLKKEGGWQCHQQKIGN